MQKEKRTMHRKLEVRFSHQFRGTYYVANICSGRGCSFTGKFSGFELVQVKNILYRILPLQTIQPITALPRHRNSR